MPLQLTATNGRARLALPAWIARATTSLPTPVSPRIRTFALLRAAISMLRRKETVVSLSPRRINDSIECVLPRVPSGGSRRGGWCNHAESSRSATQKDSLTRTRILLDFRRFDRVITSQKRYLSMESYGRGRRRGRHEPTIQRQTPLRIPTGRRVLSTFARPSARDQVQAASVSSRTCTCLCRERGPRELAVFLLSGSIRQTELFTMRPFRRRIARHACACR